MADLSRLDALLPQISGTDSKLGQVGQSAPQGGDSFSEILKNAVSSVNNVQAEADQVRQKVQRGEIKDIDETMIALQKADVSLKVMLEVRNKILDAYQEVMRTQL